MSLTTNPNDERLCRGVDTAPVQQCETYLILSKEEREKGFVRPVRQSYQHVGIPPKYPLRDLTPEEKERYEQFKYVKFEKYTEAESPIVGKFWTEETLKHLKGCGVVTKMGLELSETYARNPKFYGATYCCGCRKHLPVEEFVWDGTNERVGS